MEFQSRFEVAADTTLPVIHRHPATGYDPQALGARCSECALRTRKRPPVGASYPPHGVAPFYAIVGEAPGPTETGSGRPFDGASGRLLEQLAQPTGIVRQHAVVTNAVACMPEGVSFTSFEARFRMENAERRRRGLPVLLHPLDCCRPRLENEIAGVRDVISMGTMAMNTLIPGVRKSLEAMRGGPIILRRRDRQTKWITEGPDGPLGVVEQWEERRLLPTVHPARLFPGREPKWTGAFVSDLAKAHRFFNDNLRWTDAEYAVNPPMETLAGFLGVMKTATGWVGVGAPTYAYDFEADAKEPLKANVRCLGIGNDKQVVVVAFLSRDRKTRFYSPEQEKIAKEIIIAWALGPGRKWSWNGSSYDSLLFWKWVGIVPKAQEDVMLVQKNLETEMPHGLAYSGSVMTDVPAWKAGKEAVDDEIGAKDDESLWRYNMRDVKVTYVCGELYAAEAMKRGLLRRDGAGVPDLSCVIGLDHEKARMCRGMHVNGMLVDQEERQKHFDTYAAKATKHAAAARKIVGDPSLNLNSSTQMARKLFSRDSWNLPYNPEYVTEAGLPSVSEPQTRWLLQQPFLTDEQRAFLMAYRRAKGAEKLTSTYLTKTAPVLEGDERAVEARAVRKKADRALDIARKLWPGAQGPLWVPFGGHAERKALETVLYDLWQLPPMVTPTGKRSVSAANLVTLWQQVSAMGEEKAAQRRFLSAILSYRRHENERERLMGVPEKAEYERCTIWDDGRVHAQWKLLTATGRLNSSPNMQNIPRALRSMFIPALGRTLVSADSDQLELRVAASRWGAARYLEAFARGEDPHQTTMSLIWGDEIWGWEGAPPAKEFRFFKNAAQAWRAGKMSGKTCPEYGGPRWWEIHGYFDKQRDLAKRVQYACGKRGTKLLTCMTEIGANGARAPVEGDVAMAGRRGVGVYSLCGDAKNIEDVVPGEDWTWAWSSKRRRYELTLITDKRCTGSKPCVRVTFVYKRSFGLPDEVSSEDFTADHRFLLRDGSYRLAGDLRPGDRLMPFKRCTKTGGYSRVDATNAGTWVSEHRHVARIRDGKDYPGTTHIHHKDEDRTNNRPDNLTPLAELQHLAEHADARAEGRRNSAVWRASVSSPAARSAASKRSKQAWAARREAGTDKLGIQASVLDPLADIIGTVPDSAVVARALSRGVEVTKEAVGHWRKVHGIPSHQVQERASRGTARDRVLAQRDRLGVDLDTVIAADCACDRAVVGAIRAELGITAPSRKGLRAGIPTGSALDRWAPLAHVLSGADLSQLAGVSQGTVSTWRKRRGAVVDKEAAKAFRDAVGYVPDADLGDEVLVSEFRARRAIPAYWEIAPGVDEPLNHEVVSVEALEGLHETWDIEVDHEDHNFALASGIFVHNSQYAAELPTVYDVITSATDKTGELIFLHLTMDDVERMYASWRSNCREFPRGWKAELAHYHRYGFTMEPVAGRCFYFLDGEDLNKLANLPCQASGAAIMDHSMLAMDALYPAQYAGPGTGLVAQVHDKLSYEVLDEHADEAARQLQANMTGRTAAYPDVDFGADAEKKKYWS